MLCAIYEHIHSPVLCNYYITVCRDYITANTCHTADILAEETDDKMIEFAIGGVCNCCLDKLNKVYFLENDGVQLTVKCLSRCVCVCVCLCVCVYAWMGIWVNGCHEGNFLSPHKFYVWGRKFMWETENSPS